MKAKEPGRRFRACVRTPAGSWWAVFDEAGILEIRRAAPPGIPAGRLRGDWAGAIRRAAGGRAPGVSVPVCPSGTAFQKRVWDALRRIPHGEVRTYGAIAREIGRPRAARAVGAACAANPIPLLIPCHRVVAADGAIGGFSLGAALKGKLLDAEAEAAAGNPA